MQRAPDRDGPTGRIKIGTESEGDFRNIAISNVVFDTSRGLALESVDGANISDVAVSNITMRDVSNAPIFLRLGSRMRAPEADGGRVDQADPYRQRGGLRQCRSALWLDHQRNSRTRRGGCEAERHSQILYRGGLTLDQVAKQPGGSGEHAFFFLRFRRRCTSPREPYDTPEREKVNVSRTPPCLA